MKAWGKQGQLGAGLIVLLILLLAAFAVKGGSTPVIAISQTPLTITTPVRPQVMIAVTNSESMDGSTVTYCNGTGNSSANCDGNGFSSTYTGRGGQLMTGSGSVTGLSGSSSPLQFEVPAGFVPPISGGAANSLQNYTATNSAGYTADNSPSRLNVAKAGILSILNSYLATTDFGLLSYSTSNTSVYNTWVYYMSPSSGFTFSSSNSNPPAGTDFVLNPCYNASSGTTVYSNCSSMASALGTTITAMKAAKYMSVSATSDDASINDVLYTSGLNPLFLAYGTISQNHIGSLSYYQTGSVSVSYGSSTPSTSLGSITPTNAGFLPTSKQVMYVQRGWGYGGSQSYSAAATNVALTNLGSSPSSSAVTTAYNNFSPYLQPETNSWSTSELKAAAGQSPIYALLKTAQSSFNNTTTNGCTAQKYVVLVTDGLPTQDSSGKFWPPAGTAAATTYGVTANFNADGSVNTSTTNDQALLTTITQIQTLASNGIKTFVIGLGAGVDPSQNPSAAGTLTAMAVAGGTGSYYPAVNPQAFTTALSSILVQIQKGSYDQASVSLNTTSLNVNAQSFLASFNPSDTPNSDWTGNLSDFSLVSNGVLKVASSATWQAQTQVDTFSSNNGWKSSRLIATWDAVNSKGVPFEWPATGVTGINSTQQGQLQPSADGKGSLRLNYLRGDKSQEIQNGGGFRNRSHLLGDIVDSGPVYVGAPSGPYADSSYLTFVANNASRTPLIYVGANDGMLHAFNASTGAEQFAFVPNGVFSNLYQLTASAYNSNHLFYVDGSPQAGDVQFSDGSWHTLVTGGLAGGGQTVYGLDATTPANFTSETAVASAVLWEFSDSGMGYSYSKPAIARVNASSGFAVFFGNGYNSSGNHAILYAVNPQTGAQLAKIDLCAAVTTACSSTLPQGLSSVVATSTSGNLGSAVDMVYAGDLQGNLWAINVSASNPASWTVRLLFTAKDSSGNPQPITTTPAVTLNPNYPKTKGMMVYFGTGQLLAQTDLSNSNVQAFYGVYDNLSSTGLTPSSLLAQTETIVTSSASGFPVNTVTSTNYNWQSPVPPLSCVVGHTCPTYYGWYFNLSFIASGTRVVTDPQVYAGNVVFTTYTPSSSACTSGGSSYLMGVNFATGGAPSSPFFDANGDGVVNSQDVYGGQALSGIQLGNFFASMPAIVTTGQASAGATILTGGGNASSTNTSCSNGKLGCTTANAAQKYYWRGWWQIQ